MQLNEVGGKAVEAISGSEIRPYNNRIRCRHDGGMIHIRCPVFSLSYLSCLLVCVVIAFFLAAWMKTPQWNIWPVLVVAAVVAAWSLWCFLHGIFCSYRFSIGPHETTLRESPMSFARAQTFPTSALADIRVRFVPTRRGLFELVVPLPEGERVLVTFEYGQKALAEQLAELLALSAEEAIPSAPVKHA
jgi:membrane protein YdbS with pleckstrin-like domain